LRKFSGESIIADKQIQEVKGKMLYLLL